MRATQSIESGDLTNGATKLRSHRLQWLFVASVVLMLVPTACDQTQTGEIDDGIDETETDQTGTEEASPPRWKAPETEAEEVAAGIFEAHGGPEWEQIRRLAFRFVVETDGETTFVATHYWDLDDDVAQIRWKDDDGSWWSVVVDIDEASARSASIDGKSLEGERLEEAAEAGYHRWVNDTYWLLMPIKLFDPGVDLTLEEPIENDEQVLAPLVLSFDDVGLTPGDRYRVFIDREDRTVDHWEMMLEGRDETTIVDWREYEDIGPLRLPVERHWRDGDRKITFEIIQVNTAPEKAR